MSKNITLAGDGSNHGGSVVSSGQDGSLVVAGGEVAVEGAQHSCPLKGHGTTSISAITSKSYHNGKLILTNGAIAGCGATIISLDRSTYVE